MGHPPNQTYRLYDDTTTQLDAIANGYQWLSLTGCQTDYQASRWRYPPSCTVVMFSRSKHLTVLYRYSQLLYIDIFH